MPDTEYDFEIRSVCDNGTASDPSTNLRVANGIIIVDILVQLDCPDPGTSTTSPYYPPPNGSINYNFGTSNVLILEGEVTVSKCDNATFHNGSFQPGSGLGEGEVFGDGFGDDDSDNIYELVIAPNPSSGVFTIDAPMDSTMDIYDSQGRSWHQGEV